MMETIFSSLFTIVVALISYFYNSWRTTVKLNRKVYLKYIWQLKLNDTILCQMMIGNLPLESGCSHLRLLDPYSLRYIRIFDDHLSSQLLRYNEYLIVPITRKVCKAEEVNHMHQITLQSLESINQHLSFTDDVIGKLSIPSFLCFIGLPILIDWICRKYLSQTSNYE